MAGRQHLKAAIATLALAAGAIPLAAAADLVVELGVKDPGQGFVYVALYAKAADWMKTAMKSGRQELLSGRARLSFAGLEPGEYAISAYFDANGNGKLDAGFLGRPVEPFGFFDQSINLSMTRGQAGLLLTEIADARLQSDFSSLK